MRIVDMQRSLREVGRIRIGYSTVGTKGNKVPHKLDVFRFTAPDRETIEAAAQLYGGEVKEWDEGGRDKWEVVSTVSDVPVIIPPHIALHQAYEQYRKGFPTMRCDGETCWTPGDNGNRRPCECDPDPAERACQMTTMLNVLLPEVPGFGVWRLVSKGWYAGTQLFGTVQFIEETLGNTPVVGRLILESQEIRRLEKGKPVVKKFVVPVLNFGLNIGAALGAGPGAGGPMLAGADVVALEVAPETPAAWRAVDQKALAPAPFVSVRDQLAEVDRDPPKKRRNATPDVAPTGRPPRPEADVTDMDTCSGCGEPYGTGGPLVRNPEPAGSKFVHKACRDKLAEDDDNPQDNSQDDPQADKVPAASQGQASGGRGGVVSGPGAAPAGPAPTANGGAKGNLFARHAPATLTHGQHKAIMALTAEAFPSWDGATGVEVEDFRRAAVLRLAALLGQPDITSRTQLSHATASPLIETLEQIKAGDLVLVPDGPLVRADTGETVLAAGDVSA